MNKKAEPILSIELFADNIIVIRYPDKKRILKITNSLAIIPLLLFLGLLPLGGEEIKDIETWLDRVWIKKR
jgi:hypothetical protein